MARHEEQALWAYAKGELDAVTVERISTHLAECIPCTCAFEDVKGALGTLDPEPPPLSASDWRRIDEKVMAAAAHSVMHSASFKDRWDSFWSGLRGPVLAGAGALGVLALGLTFGYRLGRTQEPPAPSAVAVAPAVQPAPLVKPAPEPAAPAPAKALAQVDFARRASAHGERLRTGAALAAGAALATEARGEAWLALPDGSRAGLLGGGHARLLSLEADKVHLLVERGTLMVAATHRPERAFTIAAGATEIRVLGTRFLVEQTVGQTVIAVEEGQVEVATGRSVVKVPKGRALTVGRGGKVALRPLQKAERSQFSELMPDLAPAEDLSAAAPAQASPPVATRAPPPSGGGLLPRLKAPPQSREGTLPPAAAPQRLSDSAEQELSAPTPVSDAEPPAAGAAAEAPASAPDEWAGLPQRSPSALSEEEAPRRELFTGDPSEWKALPQPQDGWKAYPAKSAKVRAARPLEKEISAVEEYWVAQMERMAAEGRCRDVLYRASDWMREVLQDARGGEQPNTGIYRRVGLAKVRCLEHEGRYDEAKRLREHLLQGP